jgi:hypothetical protein
MIVLTTLLAHVHMLMNDCLYYFAAVVEAAIVRRSL